MRHHLGSYYSYMGVKCQRAQLLSMWSTDSDPINPCWTANDPYLLADSKPELDPRIGDIVLSRPWQNRVFEFDASAIVNNANTTMLRITHMNING